jgi:hypothetical protein
VFFLAQALAGRLRGFFGHGDVVHFHKRLAQLVGSSAHLLNIGVGPGVERNGNRSAGQQKKAAYLGVSPLS